MFSTIALIAAAAIASPAAPTMPARAPYYSSSGPITATYDAGSGLFCIRTGWNTASFSISRRVRRGECHTATDWQQRGVAFAPPKAQQQAKRTKTGARAQMAAR